VKESIKEHRSVVELERNLWLLICYIRYQAGLSQQEQVDAFQLAIDELRRINSPLYVTEKKLHAIDILTREMTKVKKSKSTSSRKRRRKKR